MCGEGWYEDAVKTEKKAKRAKKAKSKKAKKVTKKSAKKVTKQVTKKSAKKSVRYRVELDANYGVGSPRWVPSANSGLRDRDFASHANAERAMHRYGSAELRYRVVEVR